MICRTIYKTPTIASRISESPMTSLCASAYSFEYADELADEGRRELRSGDAAAACRWFDAARLVDPGLAAGAEEGGCGWERGVALYATGRFAEAREQFVDAEKVDGSRTQALVWHLLCDYSEHVPELDADVVAELGSCEPSFLDSIIGPIVRERVAPEAAVADAEKRWQALAAEEQQDSLFVEYNYMLFLYMSACGCGTSAVEGALRKAAERAAAMPADERGLWGDIVLATVDTIAR